MRPMTVQDLVRHTSGLTYGEPARATAPRISWLMVAGLLAVVAAIAAALGYPSPSTSMAAALAPVLGAQHRAVLGAADGVVPAGTTVFARVPGVANLDPELLEALRRAATDAAQDGVELLIESGWRSPAYQDQLLRQAVREAAARDRVIPQNGGDRHRSRRRAADRRESRDRQARTGAPL